MADESSDDSSPASGGSMPATTLASSASITAGGKIPTTCFTSPIAISTCQLVTAAQFRRKPERAFPCGSHGNNTWSSSSGLGKRVVMAKTRTVRPATRSAVAVTTTAGRTLRKPLASANSAQTTLPSCALTGREVRTGFVLLAALNLCSGIGDRGFPAALRSTAPAAHLRSTPPHAPARRPPLLLHG